MKSLLLAVAIVSTCCAALGSGSAIAASLLSGAYFLLLLGAIVAIIYCSRSTRAFWLGFAIFGWGLRWGKFAPLESLYLPIHHLLYGTMPFPEGVGNPENEAYANHYVIFMNALIPIEQFTFALLGGLLAVWLYRRRIEARNAGH